MRVEIFMNSDFDYLRFSSNKHCPVLALLTVLRFASVFYMINMTF